MNNNEACAAYFKGNPAYRRCFLEFEKKWNSYGRAKGIITLKHTSEEERRAIGGILGKTFYEDAIRFPFAEFEKGLQCTKFAPCSITIMLLFSFPYSSSFNLCFLRQIPTCRYLIIP